MSKRNERNLAEIINNTTYVDYLNRLRLVATSLFTWKGLDEIAGTGASRFLEQSLYENGRACFVKDPELGYLALKVNPSDKLNVYNLPERVMAWSIGYNKEYNFEDIIYIMNNEMQIPTAQTISLFAYRLYETERTIDTNLMAQKTPILLEGSPKAALTLKNLYEEYEGNVPFIYGNKDFDINSHINSIKTDAPYLVDKLEEHKHEIWNEAMTYLGINNANTDKKERLIVDEVNSNDDLIRFYLNCFYKTRKKACDEINDKFGLNLSIELNSDILELINETEDDIINNEGDDDDGKMDGIDQNTD